MGEKKMIKKERKTPSQKKVAAVVPAAKSISPWSYFNTPPISCPNLSGGKEICKYDRPVNLLENISRSGGITKSWILSCCTHQQPRQTWPQLVETNFSPKTINLSQWMWDSSFFLPTRYSGWDPRIPIRASTLGTRNNKTVVITGISSPAFAFRRRYRAEHYSSPWRMRDCRIAEPYSADNRPMEFTNLIEFQEKFYAISCQGSLALIEVEGDSGNYEITALGRNRAVPRCQVSKHFREYLLEYEGEIYLVFLLSRASINVVDDVEVFELDRSRLVWEKVDRLVGDAMFFLEDNCGVGISASLLGCSKGSNCVYFTHDRADGTWFVYDMKSGCISTTFGPEIDPISRIN